MKRTFYWDNEDYLPFNRAWFLVDEALRTDDLFLITGTLDLLRGFYSSEKDFFKDLIAEYGDFTASLKKAEK